MHLSSNSVCILCEKNCQIFCIIDDGFSFSHRFILYFVLIIAKVEVLVVSLFSTLEHGVVMQDSFALGSANDKLVGVEVPYYYFIKKVRTYTIPSAHSKLSYSLGHVCTYTKACSSVNKNAKVCVWICKYVTIENASIWINWKYAINVMYVIVYATVTQIHLWRGLVIRESSVLLPSCIYYLSTWWLLPFVILIFLLLATRCIC